VCVYMYGGLLNTKVYIQVHVLIQISEQCMWSWQLKNCRSALSQLFRQCMNTHTNTLQLFYLTCRLEIWSWDKHRKSTKMHVEDITEGTCVSDIRVRVGVLT